MRVHVENMELRGIEKKISKTTNDEYHIYHVEEINGKSHDIICKDVTLSNGLVKGTILNLICELDIAKYTRFEVVEVEVVN